MTEWSKFFRGSRAPAWAFFCLALLLRSAVVFLRFRGPLSFSDEKMYLRLADVVAGGRWLGEWTTAAPGPVYFWGLLRAAGFDLLGIRLVHAAAGAGAVALLFLIGRRLFGPIPATLAALVASFYPYLLFLSGVLYPQAVFQLLLLLVFYMLLRFVMEGGSRWLLLGGLFLGISILFVPALLSATPLFALWILLARSGPIGRRVGAVALLAAVTLATILPVTVRNYVVSRRFVLVSHMGGPAFYWVNNDQADPWSRDPEAWIEVYSKRLDREQARQGWVAVDAERLAAFRASRFWREQTPRAIRNYLVRLTQFFDVAPRSYTANQYTTNRGNELLAIITSVPILLLWPIGAFAARRKIRHWFPLLAVPLLQALTYAFFHVSVRYRIPFEPCFILFAVVGFCALLLPAWLEFSSFDARERLRV